MKLDNFFHEDDEVARKNYRIVILTVIISVVFVLYALRLFSLQIVNGNEYRLNADRNSSRQTTIPAQRGEIFDRNANLPLVVNIDSFAVDIIPGDIPNGYYDTVAMRLADFLGMSKSEIDEKIPRSEILNHSYTAYEIQRNVPFTVITEIAENKTDLPGVTWRNKPTRNYVETGSFSHILGFVGQIDEKEITALYNDGYDGTFTVGKAGVEKQYEKLLQGRPGSILHTIDVHGRILDDAPIIKPPESGKNIVLTINSTIQKLAEETLGERFGSIVVLKPSTGEILAMVSYPYYDSNIMSSDMTSKKNTYINDEVNSPLMNRAVEGLYPPASTFKTIMCTALLEENVFPAEKVIECPGKINYGGRVFNCHIKGNGHGYLNMKDGLAQSCDVYFWIIGRDYLKQEKISEYSKAFGFGSSAQIDLPTQAAGLVPDDKWKQRRWQQEWTGGDTMNMSIGQGYLVATPLQVANMMAMVCNSGTIYKPHLLKEVRDPVTDEVIQQVKPEVLSHLETKPEVWKQVQEALRYTITDGTPRIPMRNKSVQIAGKTGTAEVYGKDVEQWHSWMVAYAPYDAPVDEQIVVAVLVEARNTWEWYAPYAANIVIQGICNEQTYKEALDTLGLKVYLTGRRGRQE